MDRKKNIIDKIASLIPGYKGYAERDGRRNCDRVLRDSITNCLLEVEKKIDLKKLYLHGFLVLFTS